MKFFALALMLFSATAFSQGNGCTRYADNAPFMQSISKVAEYMELSLDELCSHPRVMDIHVTTTKIYNERNEAVPHVWVSLHYNEFSCQYFVRKSDFDMTKNNCYNTF